jgi:hypothetical protein
MYADLERQLWLNKSQCSSSVQIDWTNLSRCDAPGIIATCNHEEGVAGPVCILAAAVGVRSSSPDDLTSVQGAQQRYSVHYTI